MTSYNWLNKNNIENQTCYYFGKIININYLDLDNILMDKK